MSSASAIDLDALSQTDLRELRRRIRERLAVLGEWKLGRRSKHDPYAIIDKVRNGAAIGDCGVRYGTAYGFVREHVDLTGEELAGFKRRPRKTPAAVGAHSTVSAESIAPVEPRGPPQPPPRQTLPPAVAISEPYQSPSPRPGYAFTPL